MKVECLEKDGCSLVHLEGSITIENAQDFYNQLVNCVKDSKGVIFDFSKVEALDLSALQIIYSAHLAAKFDGKIFQITNLSEAAKKSAIEAGLYPEHFFIIH